MMPYQSQSAGSRKKEFWKTIQYFLALQFFFAAMLLSFSFGGKIVFGVLVGLPALVAVFLGQRKSLIFLLYFICICFVVGQRTVYIGEHFRIVPSGVLLWGLAVFCMFIKPQFKVSQKAIPLSLWLLFAGSVWGLIHARIEGRDLNVGFGYAHMMWLSIPAFFVASRLVQRFEHIKNITTILSVGCFFLSAMGIAEYLGLGFIKYFSGFVKGETIAGQGGFTRMAASFWGGPMMGGYLALCFPLILADFFSSKTMVKRMVHLTSLVFSFVAIYLSGHRGVWIPMAFSIGVYFYLKGIKGILIFVVLAAVGLHFLPDTAKSRLAGLYGQKRDSSSVKREHRIREALQLVHERPIAGHGWGASGLVHSDFVQIWADTGILGFAGYMGTFLLVLCNLYRSYLRHKRFYFREYYWGMIASVTVAALILLQQPWTNLPELYTPFWIVMALAFQFPGIAGIEKKLIIEQIYHKAESQSP